MPQSNKKKKEALLQKKLLHAIEKCPFLTEALRESGVKYADYRKWDQYDTSFSVAFISAKRAGLQAVCDQAEMKLVEGAHEGDKGKINLLLKAYHEAYGAKNPQIGVISEREDVLTEERTAEIAATLKAWNTEVFGDLEDTAWMESGYGVEEGP